MFVLDVKIMPGGCGDRYRRDLRPVSSPTAADLFKYIVERTLSG